MYFNRKNAEQKNWRMIKKGKHFLFGCSLVFAIGATLATPTVHADSVEAKAEATNSATQVEPTTEAPTYAAPAATSPVATETVEANSATTVVSADKSQLEAVLAQAKAKNLDGQETSVKAEVAAAIAEAEVLVADGTVSQDQINQSVERLNQAVVSVKEVTEVATETSSSETTESSATPKVRSRRATTEGTTRSVDESNLSRATVTKENFESFFQEGGTASYDESTGIIRLTEDKNSQAGNAYLRFKIDPDEDFTFTGKVDVGDKYEGHGSGGDGVGFVFHTGEVSKLGQAGASVGMGGIPAAFGFKLDTYHNTSNPNAAQKSIADPKYGGQAYRSNAFGAFYSSNNAGKVNTIGDARALSPAPSGQLVDFKIEYRGSTKDFTVTYGGQTWSTNLATARAGNNTAVITSEAKTALNKQKATYALSFVASTGGATNLQRVQIETFEFTAPQIVHVKYVDEQGNELASNTAVPGDEDQVVNLNNINSLQKTINALKAKGYTLKDVNKDRAETYNAAANTVTLRKGGQLLTYVFEKKEKQAASIQAPTNKVPVKNTTALTDDEKSSVEAAVKAVNPKASKVEVATDGAATVTFEDGSTATLTGAQTVKEADSKGVKAPTTKTPVQDTTALTQPEKDAVKAAVEAANPGAQAEVSANGETTVTFPDGTTATLTGDQTVKTADSNGVQAPSTKTPVKDTANLTNAEKAKVKEAVEAANPGSKAEVGQDGTTKVTFPDGSTATLTGDKTVTQADITAPNAPVVNPVKAGDKAITGTAEAGSTVEVTLPDGTKVSAKADKDGKFSIPVSGLNAGDTVSVTATDEAGNPSATTTVTVSKVNVGGKDADNAKVPVLTPVVDPSNLTDAEKAKVAEEVKKANPTATDVKVNNDGSVVVTFADGSVATIAANKVVKEATKESSAQAPAKKAGAKELPNTGTKQSNASLGLALLAAVTGGLLISKKRKEEE